LNHKQIQTFQVLFVDPIRTNVSWTDIESLLASLGAEISEGNGWRVRVYLKGVKAVFHRPHPEKEVDKGALKSVRRFLVEAGFLGDEDFK
jgi:hypothetical protein